MQNKKPGSPGDFFQTRFLPLPDATCQGEHENRAQTSGNAGEGDDDFAVILSFFFCVPKRRNKKTAPQPVLALRASLTSRRGLDAEKLGLRPQTVPASFPPPSARRGRTNGEGEERIPIGTPPSTEEAAEKGFALFERSEFAKPRQHRGAQGIPPTAGQETQGALSLVRFFGQAKK